MTAQADTREALIGSILEQWLFRPRQARLWSGVGVVLSLGIVGILISVRLDGAEGSEDIVVPAIIAGVLGLICLAGFLYSRSWVSSLRNHELILALRAEEPRIEEVTPTQVGPYPALRFKVEGGGAHIVTFDEQTRSQALTWLR